MSKIEAALSKRKKNDESKQPIMTVARVDALKILGYAFSSAARSTRNNASNDDDSNVPNECPSNPNVARCATNETTLKKFADLGINLSKNDVIMELKLFSNQNIGNLRLRVLLEFMFERYSEASKGSGKTQIAKAIVKSIRRANPPGRFLGKDRESGLYVDIGDFDAMEKIKKILEKADETLFEEENGENVSFSNGNDQNENSAYDKVFLALLQTQQSLLKESMFNRWKEDDKREDIPDTKYKKTKY
mmetsp:Transcript_13089/g.18894  ORF Transcript_13089/g.18894 Transcript_13089/m.18894 type:complete len:247 (+) Transcript_13089:59-799(+)